MCDLDEDEVPPMYKQIDSSAATCGGAVGAGGGGSAAHFPVFVRPRDVPLGGNQMLICRCSMSTQSSPAQSTLGTFTASSGVEVASEGSSNGSGKDDRQLESGLSLDSAQ